MRWRRRWGEVLGVPVGGGQDGPVLSLDGGEVRFARAEDEREQGLSEIALELPADVRDGRDTLALGGVHLRLSDLA